MYISAHCNNRFFMNPCYWLVIWIAVKQIWENDPFSKKKKQWSGQQGQIILWTGVNCGLLVYRSARNLMHTVHECMCVCAHCGTAQTLPSLSFCSSGFPQAKSTHNALLSCQRIQAPWKNVLFLCPFISSLILSLHFQKDCPSSPFFPLYRYLSLLASLALICWQENLYR